jgi:adenine phosphoribosyltransferase
MEQRLKGIIRNVPDFPKPGILFRDITPLLADPVACTEILDHWEQIFAPQKLDAVVGVESRGFLFGLALAQRLQIPFIPIRKAGKLPGEVRSQAYALEYGEAVLQMQVDSIQPGMQVLLHDDLLATGGTMLASTQLIENLGARVSAYAFLIHLQFQGVQEALEKSGAQVHYLVKYG